MGKVSVYVHVIIFSLLFLFYSDFFFFLKSNKADMVIEQDHYCVPLVMPTWFTNLFHVCITFWKYFPVEIMALFHTISSWKSMWSFFQNNCCSGSRKHRLYNEVLSIDCLFTCCEEKKSFKVFVLLAQCKKISSVLLR